VAACAGEANPGAASAAAAASTLRADAAAARRGEKDPVPVRARSAPLAAGATYVHESPNTPFRGWWTGRATSACPAATTTTISL